MGACFYRGVAPSEIKEMPFHELRYWEKWHNIIEKAYPDAVEAAKAKNGDK